MYIAINTSHFDSKVVYSDEKLMNKNGDWMYMEETWILSNENETEEGQVVTIRDAHGRGLKAQQQQQQQRHSIEVRIARDTEIWIKKEVDVDGYFLLQTEKRYREWGYGDKNTSMFLTAEDASSLTVEGK